MEVKHLKYFTEIVKYGSINKASQAIFISQPYLSNVVKELETELDTKLIERHKTGITLTPSGEKLLIHANKVLSDMESLKSSFSPLHSEAETLSVSVMGFCHLMDTFTAFCKENSDHSKFTYVMKESGFLDVVNDVKNNASQIGIIHHDVSFDSRYKNYLEKKNISYYPLDVMSPCILIGKNHPVYKKNSSEVTLEELRDYGFLSYTGPTDDFLYNLLVDGNMVNLDKWEKKVCVYDRGTLINLLEKTDFFSIGLAPAGFRCKKDDLAILPIRKCENLLTFGYILRNETEISPMAEKFIDLLKKDFTM